MVSRSVYRVARALLEAGLAPSGGDRRVPLVGNIARWRGGEYFADVVGDKVFLTVTVEEGPAGFRRFTRGPALRQRLCRNAGYSSGFTRPIDKAFLCAYCIPAEGQPNCFFSRMIPPMRSRSEPDSLNPVSTN